MTQEGRVGLSPRTEIGHVFVELAHRVTGALTTEDRPPPPTPFPRLNMVGGGHGGPACDKDEEEWRMAINLLLAHLPCGSAAEAPGLNLRSKENYVAFPLSHHESAGLDKTKLW